MEGKLILRGMLAGLVGGLFAYVFARIFAEPKIQAAINFESARDKVQDALDKAQGIKAPPEGPDIVSRAVQSTVGLGVGVIGFGVAMGALFAVVYSICLGRVGRLQPRPLALLVAAGGFLGFYLVPFIKYPANPPSIGHPETIGTRSGLYLIMVGSSLLLLVLSVVLGKKLQARFGNWNATLIAAAAFVVVIGAVMAALPLLGHLAVNVRQYGLQATETPLPLTNSSGAIVFPGFPADVLFKFRLLSVAAQLILWTALGLIFAPLADRVLRPLTVAPRVAVDEQSPVSTA